MANRNFLLYLPAIRFPNQHRGQTPPMGPDPSTGKPARSGYSQDNAPIPGSIPLRVIGYFPAVFARRLPHLDVEIGVGSLHVLADGLCQVFLDLDRYFMAFPQYLLLTYQFLNP